MTLGKLLDNNPTLHFYVLNILKHLNIYNILTVNIYSELGGAVKHNW